jgi:hypothetical protein
MNTLEKFHTHNLSKHGTEMNETYSDMSNTICHVILKSSALDGNTYVFIIIPQQLHTHLSLVAHLQHITSRREILHSMRNVSHTLHHITMVIQYIIC